jgi:hypothetical protein
LWARIAPESPTARTPLAARSAHKSTVDAPGDGHLHDLERGLVGDAAAGDHARLDAEPFRQLGRLRPAAVHDHHALAARREPRDVAGNRLRLVARCGQQQFAAQLEGDYGHEPESSSVAFSSTPSMMFML